MAYPATDDADLLIVGGGIAGLTCALRAQELGLQAIVFEKNAVPGGRVATSQYGDCRADHGFQILLTAYPEVRRFLDLETLDLGYFARGCHVWDGSDWRSLVSPLDEPGAVLRSLDNKMLSMGDFVRLAREILGSRKVALSDLFSDETRSTQEYLVQQGYSPASIEHFFRPFLGGVFLDDALETSAGMFRFVMQMFATGGAALPSGGMEAIPEQMVTQFKSARLLTDSPVATLSQSERSLTLADGSTYRAPHLVVATDLSAARKLIGDAIPDVPHNASITWNFRIPEDTAHPLFNKTLRLVSDSRSPIRVIALPSKAASGYAPSDIETLTVTQKDGEAQLDEATLRKSLKSVLGSQVDTWTLLARQAIPHSLPSQTPSFLKSLPRLLQPSPHTFICGDFLESRSLNGAMYSGRLVSESISQQKA